MSSRREFLLGSVKSITAVTLLQELCLRRVFAKAVHSNVEDWVIRTSALATSLTRQEITALQWQAEMEKNLAQIDLADFCKYIDFDLLEQRASLPARGEAFEKFNFKKIDGISADYSFYQNLAGFKKGRSIPPHGHYNLVSSFIVLRGELHGRHFDRLSDDGRNVALKPTIDRIFKKGDYSTVSETKDNVHWFTALSERSFIFDLGIGDVTQNYRMPGSDATIGWQKKDWSSEISTRRGRVYLDLGTEVGDKKLDLLHATHTTHSQAYEKYG